MCVAFSSHHTQHAHHTWRSTPLSLAMFFAKGLAKIRPPTPPDGRVAGAGGGDGILGEEGGAAGGGEVGGAGGGASGSGDVCTG